MVYSLCSITHEFHVKFVSSYKNEPINVKKKWSKYSNRQNQAEYIHKTEFKKKNQSPPKPAANTLKS